ncbi:putative disease resistance protein At3g14460 [Abrus precatorius]|uniref:Disease resistance protein At3g14460 n=1 Tax=Abrus precatorius TaxID=3816 RepID=A0A8B8L8M6_ABRPR|nr:putative disease resistance protein At3g14460 [Abrus precatorius]
MPSHMRHCFAYFSLYPKDSGFTSSQITNLWVALGLLQSSDGSQKQENIARQYIDELRSRSFLQDFEDFGHFYYFKVHDLVHDLALYVAKEEFVVVNSHTRNIPEHVRHLSIVENNSLGRTLFPKSRSVRSILFPIDGVGLDSETLLDTWVARYKYLRVLDLSDSSFQTLPNSTDKLEHLRILNLSNNRKIKRLPHSICKLQNLLVLSLRGCMELETLPKGLGKLISLRQLYITTKQSVLSHNEISSLSNLQTLSFEYCYNLEFLFGVEQLSSLEALIVQSCRSLKSLPLSILPKLEALLILDCKMLNLSLMHENPIEEWPKVGSPVQRLSLKFLHLEYFQQPHKLPRWIEGAAYTLQTLLILNFSNLEMLPEWLTTMTHLKMLHIVNCPQLFYLPSDMHRLTSLEDLTIDGCSVLCRRCKPQSGQYWPMIAHIKRLSIGEPGPEWYSMFSNEDEEKR